MNDNFNNIQSRLQKHLDEMTKDTNVLFVTGTDRDALWELYLKSFPEGTNPILQIRTEHDCSACRHFIKSFGNVVSLKNGVITSLWDFDIPKSRYDPVVKALSVYVKSFSITDILATDTNNIGVQKNFEQNEDGSVCTWEHFHAGLHPRFINGNRSSLSEIRGKARDLKNVFKRSLDEISQDSVLSVLELIAQNSLYKGEEWKGVLETFNKHQKSYEKLSLDAKELYCWEQSRIAGPVVGKIRNHSIGTLLVDLCNGTELDEAVRKYESIVAPTNYKRPKAIITPGMVKLAENTITELGYLNSLPRRFANLSDITINNILFANRDVIQKLSGNVFDSMKKEAGVAPKNFDRVEEVSMETFISEILPTATSVEVMVENKHSGNLVSLIAPINFESPSMFKWNNGFSWAYTGNITDSMKQRVKAAGGDVTGVLRFSIEWNQNHDNEDDLDAHCIEPNGNEIYFRNKGRRHLSTGMLDVDIIQPSRQTTDGVAVENITWSDVRKMPEGVYKLFVHNYHHIGGRSGFTAEVEFDNKIYSFSYNKELRQDEKVQVAEVTFNKSTGFSIKEMIPSSLASRKLWSLDTNQFHEVSVIMMSPNFWDAQSGIGNRHFFFMLKGCMNEESPNGFFNEYLKNELLGQKRVFEVLGGKMKVAASDDQLSGLGFSSTQKNTLVVKVTGHVNRTLKVIV